MPMGKIKWFSHHIGAGFIRSDEGENIFFHSSVFRGRGKQGIREGQQVHFDVAKNIKSLSPTAASVTITN